jgi:hypothetical protein
MVNPDMGRALVSIFLIMWRSLRHRAGILIFLCAVMVADSQNPTVPPAQPATAALFSPSALDQLLKPIALYPDPLLAEIFVAATLPSQIVLADRYVNQGGDVNQAAQQPWDPSIQAMVHYPTVLKWLDDNLAWTTDVGQAFLNQQQDVMNSVQRLRAQAQAEGNLPSTPQENVVADDGIVEIVPVDPEVIYVPVYPWDTIYDEPGIYCGFGIGFPIGFWLGYDWDWRHYHFFGWGPGFPRPRDWWQRPPGGRVPPRGVTEWHPGGRGGAAAVRGPDRGFSADTFRPGRISAPSTPAPSVGAQSRGVFSGRISPPAATMRPPISVRPSLPSVESRPPSVESRPPPVVRESPGVSAFGGPENSFDARQSSVRGFESRGAVSGGGGGGGGGGRRR